MIVTIHNCVESVMNSEGRFKTLESVCPIMEASGIPKLYSQMGFVTFDVMHNDRPHQIKCFLNKNTLWRNNAMTISNHTAVKHSPYITRFQYLSNEMLVFSASGRPNYCDVILQEVPQGIRLDLYALQYFQDNNRLSLNMLYDNLSAMVKWMHENGFTHRTFCPKNIIITPDGQPVLINYETSEYICSTEDHRAIAAMFALFFTAICQPEYFLDMSDKYPIYKDLATEQIKRISQIDVEPEIAMLKELCQAIVDGDNVLDDWDYIYNIIRALRRFTNRQFPSLSKVWLYDNPSKTQEKRIIKDRTYVYIGNVSDNMRRAYSNNNQWSYLDSNDDETIEGPFDYAYDFIEGRASVSFNHMWGLIDKTGKFIIPPIYEDLTWDGDSNLAIVDKHNYFGVFNRSGEEIIPMEYDSMQICSEGLILAEYDGYYGYLTPKGETAIPFIYEDGTSFRDGIAQVTLDGRIISINQSGEDVNSKLF